MSEKNDRIDAMLRQAIEIIEKLMVLKEEAHITYGHQQLPDDLCNLICDLADNAYRYRSNNIISVDSSDAISAAAGIQDTSTDSNTAHIDDVQIIEQEISEPVYDISLNENDTICSSDPDTEIILCAEHTITEAPVEHIADAEEPVAEADESETFVPETIPSEDITSNNESDDIAALESSATENKPDLNINTLSEDVVDSIMGLFSINEIFLYGRFFGGGKTGIREYISLLHRFRSVDELQQDLKERGLDLESPEGERLYSILISHY